MNMNKKDNPNEVRNYGLNIRLSKDELQAARLKSKEFGFSCATAYGREMVLNGYVQATPTQESLIDVKALRQLLIEFRTNFSRIANYMKHRDLRLVHEINQTMKGINHLIEQL